MGDTRHTATQGVILYEDGKFLPGEKKLMGEVCRKILVNGKELGQITCSPWNPREAVLGWLFMERVIADPEEITRMDIGDGIAEISTGERKACRKWTQTFSPIGAQQVLALAARLEELHRTAGVHSAALAEPEKILVFKEDVSRHEAVDRVAGACLSEGIPMEGRILVFSGRVPEEIVKKGAKMGCAMIIARSAPTEPACRMAEEKKITLVGLAREGRFCIYTCPERICKIP